MRIKLFMITIKDKKLVDMLKQKEVLVEEGRAISKKMESIERDIEKCETEEKKITAEVEPVELKEEAEAFKKEIDELIKKFEKVANLITKTKLDAIPKDLADRHRALMKEREEKERERNKVALKIQKIKDRIVPKIAVIVKPQLKEYEDVETATIKNDEIVIKTFSYLEEWKKGFEARKAK